MKINKILIVTEKLWTNKLNMIMNIK